MRSANSSQPARVTIGNCMEKLIGVSAETSPIFSARVHSSWPMVPSTPDNTSHSQAMPCGGCQTNSAGSADIGTHST